MPFKWRDPIIEMKSIWNGGGSNNIMRFDVTDDAHRSVKKVLDIPDTPLCVLGYSLQNVGLLEKYPAYADEIHSGIRPWIAKCALVRVIPMEIDCSNGRLACHEWVRRSSSCSAAGT